MKNRFVRGCALLGFTVVFGSGPLAGAAKADPISDLKPEATIEEVCQALLTAGERPSASGAQAQGPGNPVPTGEVAKLGITWETQSWQGDELQNLVTCPTAGGKLVDNLSVKVSRVQNSGSYQHTFKVPADLAPGTELCDQAVLLGTAPDGGVTRQATGSACLTVAQGAAAGPSSPQEPVVAGATEERAGAPSESAAPEGLARTGAHSRLLRGLSGMLLILGGLAVAFGARGAASGP